MIEPWEKLAIGRAARRLLEFAWAADPRDSYMVKVGIMTVVQTFGSDPAASEVLLRRVIDPARLPEFGHEELSDLFRHGKNLVELAPGFLADCYAAAFGYRDESEEKTQMLPSQLLGLTSNRRQDYDMARYELQELFPYFLERSPQDALNALDPVLRSSAFRYFAEDDEQDSAISFVWRDKPTEVVPDGRYMFLGGPSTGDAAEEILNHFAGYVARIADTGDTVALERLRDLLVGGRLGAGAWRHVLSTASQHPTTMGMLFADLLKEPALLAPPELRIPLGQLMSAVFADLEPDARGGIEKAICALPNQWPDEQVEHAESVRDTYLRGLPTASLTTTEAREMKAVLDREPDTGPPLPTLSPGAYVTGYTRTEAQADMGADLSAPITKALNDETQILVDFIQQHRNGAPGKPECEAASTHIGKLLSALQDGAYDAADPIVYGDTWTELADAAAVVARNAKELTDNQADTIRAALLAASQRPQPVTHNDLDEYDKNRNWTRTPRTEGAFGLCCLMHDERNVNVDTRDALRRLAAEPEPSVRQQVARGCVNVAEVASDLLTEIVDGFVQNELSAVVLDSVQPAVVRVLRADFDHGEQVIQTVLNREREREQPRESVLEAYATTLICHHIWEGTEPGHVLAGTAATDLQYWRKPIRHVTHAIRPALIVGTVGADAETERAIRQRALALDQCWLDAATSTFEEIRRRYTDRPEKWSETDIARFRIAAEVVDHIGAQLYYTSGLVQGGNRNPHQEADPEQRQRLYNEAHDLLETIARVGVPRPVHHLIQFAAACAENDPRGVFLLIADAVRGGAKWGYQFEPMAEGEVVRIVTNYLTDRRELFEDDNEMQTALMDILDTFVSAGWPGARKLVYGLGELFR